MKINKKKQGILQRMALKNLQLAEELALAHRTIIVLRRELHTINNKIELHERNRLALQDSGRALFDETNAWKDYKERRSLEMKKSRQEQSDRIFRYNARMCTVAAKKAGWLK